MQDTLIDEPKPKTSFPLVTVIVGAFCLSCVSCSVGMLLDGGFLVVVALIVLLIAIGLLISKMLIVFGSVIFFMMSAIRNKFLQHNRTVLDGEPTHDVQETAIAPRRKFPCSLIVGIAAAVASVFLLYLSIAALGAIEPSQSSDDMAGITLVIFGGAFLILFPLFLIFASISGVFLIRFRLLKEKVSIVAIVGGFLLACGIIAFLVFLFLLIVNSIPSG